MEGLRYIFLVIVTILVGLIVIHTTSRVVVTELGKKNVPEKILVLINRH